ncbi:cupin domain-containing protein [Paraburkholderia youngii]|uniref:cupin domain-containing protein n=1 Tax=Paraburkholderia youngii TaxID=2782701 RepID=UPI003D256A61
MPDSRAIADDLIRRFDLKPHPEGGFFAETYRSATRVLRAGEASETENTRAASTAIYYMLCDRAHSAWHRIRSDEVWHFYAGEPLLVHMLDESDAAGGALVTHRLGNPLTHPDTVYQAVVPAGMWFAAECADPASFALVGCTVAPGFEFSEFELAEVDALMARHPRHAELIGRLGAAR